MTGLRSLPTRALIRAERLVTCDPSRATTADPLGVIEDGALLIESGSVVDSGKRAEVLARAPDAIEIDLGRLITPGLCDAHTHAAYAGSRDDEYQRRLRGEGYEEIASAGGGIVSSMRAVRAISRSTLVETIRARLGRMASLGVTTVEVKSGYGLDLENEMKQLEAIAQAADDGLPRTVPTYLALHAVPPEAHGDRVGYAQSVRDGSIDAVANSGIARFVDAYVDRSAFSVEQVRPTLERARQLGLGVRLHVGQFADVGGAELAAELGALSADHLENVSPGGAAALAGAKVRAVLLPVASFVLGQSPPPVELLRREGVKLVVASDANPGTAPTESLPLAMAFAARSYGLTLAETLLGVTREAALSLSLDRAGFLGKGSFADLVAWDLPHEAALLQPHGTSRALTVLREGRLLAGSLPAS